MFSIVRVPIMRNRFARFVMGKPYLGEDLKQIWEHNIAKKEKDADKKNPITEKFTKSFQTYLDMVADDLKKNTEEKQSIKSS